VAGSPEIAVDAAALRALERTGGDEEQSQSSYWRQEVQGFDIDKDGVVPGAGPMGNVSRKTGILRTNAHWVLQTPFRFIGRRFATFAETQRLGRLVANRQGRQLTQDMMRQVLALSLIRDHLGGDIPEGAAVVIGDGYGVMTSLVRLTFPDIPVVAVNLTKPLLADLAFAKRAVPDTSVAAPDSATGIRAALARRDIGIIGVRADDAALLAEVPVGMAINIHSMQEMSTPVIARYFELLRAAPSARTAFYCCNRVEKRLYDGEIIRFDEYPWKSGDTILMDEICPWDHWEYGTRPPFWRRNPNIKRHRLAFLEKVSAG